VRDPYGGHGEIMNVVEGSLELQAKDCERARENKRYYNISEARYCREVCRFNKNGVCQWEK
jgi:hypothetical protein